MLIFEERATTAAESNHLFRDVNLGDLPKLGPRGQVKIVLTLWKQGLVLKTVEHFFKIVNLH